jgi:hypothetical protein
MKQSYVICVICVICVIVKMIAGAHLRCSECWSRTTHVRSAMLIVLARHFALLLDVSRNGVW